LKHCRIIKNGFKIKMILKKSRRLIVHWDL